jgi:DNA-damage-inducible protein D
MASSAGRGQAISDHAQGALRMIAGGIGARRKVEDVRLSRYTCYVITRNADPEKLG